MATQTQHYLHLLQDLSGLQEKLAHAVETQVKVVTLPQAHLDMEASPQGAIRPGRTISQVWQRWPSSQPILPWPIWIKPTRGLLLQEDQGWLFDFHGKGQLSMLSFPLELAREVQGRLESAGFEALHGLCVPASSDVEITYLKGGQTHSVDRWSAYMFARSIGSQFGELTEADHAQLLASLAEQRDASAPNSFGTARTIMRQATCSTFAAPASTDIAIGLPRLDGRAALGAARGRRDIATLLKKDSDALNGGRRLTALPPQPRP